jgi:hypothetical protein
MAYLTPKDALIALANGRILENDEGAEVLLAGAGLVLRYTMGKNNAPVTNTYKGSFDNLSLPETGGA